MKKVLMIIIPLLLIGGGVVGAAMMGLIEIPGLSPAKKKSKAAAQYTEEKETPPVAKHEEKEPEPPKVEPPAPDLDKGRKKLAQLWNELEAAQILLIAADWKDDELAKQIRFLDGGKAAELLAAMKPDQASKISKMLQELASQEPKRTS